jgi:molybdenum cofactor biosynthesis enzyme MoaA
MSAAIRQQKRRKRVKEAGLVDIRVEIPTNTRDKVREMARNNKRTMKAEISAAIDKHIC